jgi:hypothetical protein
MLILENWICHGAVELIIDTFGLLSWGSFLFQPIDSCNWAADGLVLILLSPTMGSLKFTNVWSY